jgi:Fe-S cluster assembly scaffold protein SufB
MTTKTLVKLENEPEFITNFREINNDIYELAPNKKSVFYNVEDYNKMLENYEGKNVDVIEGKNVEKYSWKEVFENKEILSIVENIIKSEPTPRDQFEAFINANFLEGNIYVIKEGEAKINVQTKGITKNIFIIKSGAKLLHEFDADHLMINNTIYLENETKDSFIVHSPKNDTGIINFETIAGSNVEAHSSILWFKGSKIKSSYVNVVNGEGTNLYQNDLLFLDSGEQIDVDMIALHNGRASLTDTKLKCALKGNGRQSFDGMIKIAKGAQQTDSYLEANSMLLSEDARSINVPKLEIEADDVKATHAATVEHLEEEKIFYLQTRGMSAKAAREIIISSFLQGTTVEYPEYLREKIRERIEEKLNN